MFSFVGQVLRNYSTTGAVLPSSLSLARSMTRSIRDHEGAKRVLEVGPGTGAFTRQILTTLAAGDEFHIVEINEAFCHSLEEATLAPFRAATPVVEIHLHQAAIQAASIEGPFDYIVCGLPFNNFPLPVVRSIFRKLLSLLGGDGELTYFEYVGMKAVKMPWVGADGRRRLRRRIAVTRFLEDRYRGERDLILRNVPPAHAIRLRSTRVIH